MTDKLKPCPFCGSGGNIEELDGHRRTFQANCSSEYCDAYQFLFSSYATRKQAAEAWNTRAVDEENKRLRGVLEKVLEYSNTEPFDVYLRDLVSAALKESE